MGASRSVKCVVVLLATSFVLAGVPIERKSTVRAASIVEHIPYKDGIKRYVYAFIL